MKNPVLALIVTIAIALVSTPTSAQSSDLDLPITPVKFGDTPPAPSKAVPTDGPPTTPTPVDTKPPVPDDDDDDPRDSPPPIFYGEEIQTETDSIFYVVDTSGSMDVNGSTFESIDGSIVSGTKFDRAKAELKRSISGLSDNFEFNIIAYSCWINIWSMQMQQATPASKSAAYAWIDARYTDGGTATGPATAGALTFRENFCVVLLTDGAPNCGGSDFSSHRSMIRSANTQGAVINVFGIAATGPYRAFCQGIAADSGGQYFDLP